MSIGASPVFLSFFLLSLLGCVTPEPAFSARQAMISEYLESHPNREADIRSAMQAGRVVPGMTEEEAFIASGVYANKLRGYVPYQVAKDGKLFQPYVIPPDVPTAVVTSNFTQYASSTDETFIIYFDSRKRVTEVKRGRGF